MKQKERVSSTRITGHTGVRIDGDLYKGDYKNPLILDVRVEDDSDKSDYRIYINFLE